MTIDAEGDARPTKPDGITPSQTVGPFFAYVLTPKAYGYPELVTNEMATSDAAGTRIRIEGCVIDGDGEPVIDAMLELWQSDGEGRFASETGRPGSNAGFTGFGRSDVDSNGFYFFETVKPGIVPGPNGAAQAPHIDVGIFARGLLRRLFTRIYFNDEAANATDPILALVPEERRTTLIAVRRERGGQTVYEFNIRLQGDNETVFFEN
jgi:protocatechuate 3,4-dioxygenase alpha subunit